MVRLLPSTLSNAIAEFADVITHLKKVDLCETLRATRKEATTYVDASECSNVTRFLHYFSHIEEA